MARHYYLVSWTAPTSKGAASGHCDMTLDHRWAYGDGTPVAKAIAASIRDSEGIVGQLLTDSVSITSVFPLDPPRVDT